MIKNFYAAIWILLLAVSTISFFANTFNWAALVVYSLIALVLVYALALWTVIVNGRNNEDELSASK